jgi:nucleotide-binding universal stress UspA family protein
MNAPVGPVLIAYDGSAAAHRAVADAAKLMGSCRMLVVTVWEEGLAYATPVMPPDGMIMEPMVEPGVALDVDRELHRQAERVSRQGADLARSLGVDAVPLATPTDGSVPRTILHVARERQAAAIVVGSRGLSGLRARLEGSTSKHVLKHASCPVIVVHEPDERDD